MLGLVNWVILREEAASAARKCPTNFVEVDLDVEVVLDASLKLNELSNEFLCTNWDVWLSHVIPPY